MGKAGLVPGVVGLVTVWTMVDNVLFCLILFLALLCFMGSAAHFALDDVDKSSGSDSTALIRAPRGGGRKPLAAQGQLG